MQGGIKDFLACLLFLSALWISGCSGCGQGLPPADTTSSSSSGGGGMGGGGAGPCGMDCATITTPPCLEGVCNTGQYPGQLNTCVIVPSPKGRACDDGKYCTTNDACDAGVCVGGMEFDCGIQHKPCSAIICYEDSQSCDETPVDDGTSCTPEELCEINGVCTLGVCVGEPKDCSFSPLNECNSVECDPHNGLCKGTPDPAKNNAICLLTGDLCSVDKTCQNGQCVGGNEKDCSAFDVECDIGVCHSANGVCGSAPAPTGTPCTEGVAACQVGECNANGACKSSAAPDGVSCNDHDACTSADHCQTGVCGGGAPVAGCVVYLKAGFENCPGGWDLSGDWECGTPTNVGPATAHSGHGAIGTQIDGVYHVDQAYNMATADSPPINLTAATSPQLSFWAWDHTEGGTFDGWNLKVSTNGGNTFAKVNTVTPAYPLVVNNQPAWGGDHSAEGWQNYSADLSAYAGKTIILRFSFRSDGATVFPGVYIDDVVVAEPLQIPIYITTSSLPDVYAGVLMSVPITRVGGTAGAVWSIKPGGLNDAWLSIDPSTGVLFGAPSAAQVGAVSVTVHVEEATLPSNFDERTFTFRVIHDAYYTSWEGTCPDGWTLTGDWQCGTPTNVGPPTAYVGTQCIGTQIAGNYHTSQTYAGTTATSPDIDLTSVPSPKLKFRMWIDSEGAQYDGVNLKISTDGGMNYSVVTTVMPGYNLTVDGEPAWGGREANLGWQPMEADLSAYTGQVVRLRFSFRTDTSGEYPGIYVDDFFLN